jgi:hypothetical protein
LAANAGNAGGEASTASCPEDLYQLLPSSAPLGKPFAMIIRLQPEILEELKQADAEGRELSMKFGLNAAEHVSGFSSMPILARFLFVKCQSKCLYVVYM